MSYLHLTIEERSCIYQFKNLGMSIIKIAIALKRNSITTKNKSLEFIKYFPIAANKKYELRRLKCKKKDKFNDGDRTIKKRPKEIELGYWECDTVESGRIDHKRKSRFYTAIISALRSFPKNLVKTITFDKCKTYFCDPYCAWQKGTNENSNGLLREFYPKGMDLSEVDEKELKKNLDLLNNRPRKCIKYKTPNEIIFNNSH